MIHITNSGEEIRLEDLNTTHLINIIKQIKRRAESGVRVELSGLDEGRAWQRESIVYGDTALKLLNYSAYITEVKRRGIPAKIIITIDTAFVDEREKKKKLRIAQDALRDIIPEGSIEVEVRETGGK